jgi:AraC-like DNA-binding protein
MPRIAPPLFIIPFNGTATLVLAGRFPLGDRGSPVNYASPHTHALHLHGYCGRFRLDDCDHPLRPGDLTLTPAGVSSRYDLDAPGYCWCIHFGFSRTQTPSVKLPAHLSLGVHAIEAERRLAEIAHLHACARPDRHGRTGEALLFAARARLCFQDLLLWIAGQFRHPAGREKPLTRASQAVEQAAALLATRLVDPPTVPELAETLELSQNYLASLFRRRFGMTIQQYLLRRRIEYARHLLLSTDLPASKIGARVGLPDPRHFNKRFRSLTGQTPGAARAGRRV